MTTTGAARSSFPLRFANERTRERLRVMAQQLNTSMNQLAEEMIERELEVLSLGLEQNLAQTLELLRSYGGEDRGAAWARFAEAEGNEDPIRTRRIAPERDPYRIADAFAEAGR